MNGSDAQQQPPANKDSATLGSERSERENELLRLEITGIRPYEHNPRRTENSAYERIKASIHADGLAQPLVVTKRPGEPDYRVAAGGNTRLQILQELHAETGDERFLRVPVSIGTGQVTPTCSSPILRRTTCAGSSAFSTKRRRWPRSSN